MKKALLAAGAGTLLEMYDYSLYGYMATVLAKVFFPAEPLRNSLLYIFSIFALGFLARPLGALVLGQYGDKWGRKKLLLISTVIMTISSAAIGLLPSYPKVGVLSPTLLIILRLFQGFSVAGEFSIATIFVAEHANKAKIGLITSFLFITSAVGFLAAVIISQLLISSVSSEELIRWVWRLPFLFGIIIGLIALYIRFKTDETPIFKQVKQEKKLYKRPLWQAMRYYFLSVVITFFLIGLTNGGFYIFFVYMATYISNHLSLPINQTLPICGVSLIVYMICLPISGKLSDLIGRTTVMRTSALAILVLVYPLFYVLSTGNLASAYLIESIFGLLLGFYIGPVPATIMELFPAVVRASGVTFTFNLATSLIGGTAPLIAESLTHFTGNNQAPSFYLMLLAIFALIVISFIQYTRVASQE